MNSSDLRLAWLKQQPTYRRLASYVEQRLKLELRRRGVFARVTSREKDIGSLVKKAIRKKYRKPLSRMSDKAGARVVVFFLEQLPLVDEVIRTSFHVHKVENKQEGMKPNEVGYLSTHYDVSIVQRDSPLTNGLLRKRCEVQVRTLCEDVYAEISHVLAYKTEMNIPDKLLRQVQGMSALLELADREFEYIRRETMSLPGANIYKIRSFLEMLYYQFAANQIDLSLTDIVLVALQPILQAVQVEEIEARIDHFVKERVEQIEHVFGLYSEIDAPIFLTQPESLLLFYLIEQDPYKLASVWAASLPIDELEELAAAWGRPLPVR